MYRQCNACFSILLQLLCVIRDWGYVKAYRSGAQRPFFSNAMGCRMDLSARKLQPCSREEHAAHLIARMALVKCVEQIRHAYTVLLASAAHAHLLHANCCLLLSSPCDGCEACLDVGVALLQVHRSQHTSGTGKVSTEFVHPFLLDSAF